MKFRTLSMSVVAMTMILVISAACSNTSNSPTSTGGDVIAPIVSSTNPVNGATAVAVINATFSEAMSASTINAASFLVTGPGAAAVLGSVSYNASTYVAASPPPVRSRRAPLHRDDHQCSQGPAGNSWRQQGVGSTAAIAAMSWHPLGSPQLRDSRRLDDHQHRCDHADGRSGCEPRNRGDASRQAVLEVRCTRAIRHLQRPSPT
jgi:hypothetical protein